MQGVGNNRILVDRASNAVSAEAPRGYLHGGSISNLGSDARGYPRRNPQGLPSARQENHPDLHPSDKGAEARFKEIASAYDIVGDEKKRARFDSGEIDSSGAEQQRAEREFYRQHAEAGPPFRYEQRWSGPGYGDPDDLFAGIFGARSQRAKARGADVHYTFSVEFTEAINGAKKRVVMADGKSLEITIPAGLKDGQTLRLRGQGQQGLGES